MMSRIGLAAIAAGALVFVVVATAAERQGDFVWAGKWSTTFGTLELSGSGGSVTGTYPHEGGQIKGSASGNVLKGTWTEEPTRKGPIDAGDFTFVMKTTATTVTFEGTWNTVDRKYGGAWNGQCFQGPCLTNKGRPTPTPTEPDGIDRGAITNAIRSHNRMVVGLDESNLLQLMHQCKSLYPANRYRPNPASAEDKRLYWREVANAAADAKSALRGLKKLLATVKNWQGDAMTPKAIDAVKAVRAALEREILQGEKAVAALSKMLAEYQYLRRNPSTYAGRPCLLERDITTAVQGLRRAHEATMSKLVRLSYL